MKDQLQSPSRKNLKTKSPKDSTTLQSKTKPGKEVRCIKFSPNVMPPRYQPSIENNEWEGKHWRLTFASMGQLKALGLDEVKTFTKLPPQPYHHCAPMARKFEASYGPLARIETKKPKEKGRGHRYYAGKKDSTLPSITKNKLPKITASDDPFSLPRHLLTGQKQEDLPYIPKSAIRIHWSEHVANNVDLICDWLAKTFGPILFTVNEGEQRLIIVYMNIKSAYVTVNAGIPPKLMTVTWCDPKFYNYGHYNMYKNYKLSTDPIWLKGMEDD